MQGENSPDARTHAEPIVASPVSARDEADRLMRAFEAQIPGDGVWQGFSPTETEAGQALLMSRADVQLAAVHVILARRAVPSSPRGAAFWTHFTRRRALDVLLDRLLSRQLPYGESDVAAVLTAYRDEVKPALSSALSGSFPCARVLTRVEQYCAAHPLPGEWRAMLEVISSSHARIQASRDERKLAERADRLLGYPLAGPVESGEPWADRLLSDLGRMSPRQQGAWSALLEHAASARASQPSGKWRKSAEERVSAVGTSEFVERVVTWFPLAGEPRTTPLAELPPWAYGLEWAFSDRNQTLLKGLVWCCIAHPEPTVIRALGQLADSCYRKIPGVGARCPRVGNAVACALGAMAVPHAVAQLTRLRSPVDQPSCLKQIEQALAAAAARAGATPEDLEEASVPTFDLPLEGECRRELAGCTALVGFRGTRLEIEWIGANGRPVKAPPQAVRQEAAEEFQALKRTVKELQAMLLAQRDRLERLLPVDREWTFATWRKHYLDHPLISRLARPLIWHFRSEEAETTAIWCGGELQDVGGAPVAWLADDTRVRLWHPIHDTPEAVLAWRLRLEDWGAVQPFKQAHREVYLLTDAERRTGTYSNRFAGHILRQHQFAALCKERGWSYRLQGTWDTGVAPMASLPLPRWGLRAELWVEIVEHAGASGMGAALCVASDQLRFETGRGPRPLAEIPPALLSEVLRDVDLFVGVTSIAADPNWADHGERRFGEYWEQASFGELGEMARTRHELLGRLLPRLKIRDRCSLDDRFLHVRGKLRSYRIHVGSGNVLMEPGQRYLCIVPARVDAGPDRVFLPFEGDPTLAVILSKAFLLAEDDRIKDPSIVSQIRG